jgi:hypothetical protein
MWEYLLILFRDYVASDGRTIDEWIGKDFESNVHGKIETLS